VAFDRTIGTTAIDSEVTSKQSNSRTFVLRQRLFSYLSNYLHNKLPSLLLLCNERQNFYGGKRKTHFPQQRGELIERNLSPFREKEEAHTHRFVQLLRQCFMDF